MPETATPLEALESTSAPSETWNRLFSCERQRLPGVFFLDEHSTFWTGVDDVFVPDIPRSDDPDAWQPDDGTRVVGMAFKRKGTP